jgi:hypothetical protein
MGTTRDVAAGGTERPGGDGGTERSPGGRRPGRRGFVLGTAGALAGLGAAGTAAGIALSGDAGAEGKPERVRRPAGGPEFRGLWLATVTGRDWPSRAGLSAGEQRAELIALLDSAVARRLNAVVF